MRLTAPCYRHKFHRWLKGVWATAMRPKEHQTVVPLVLREKGVEIVDPITAYQKPRIPFTGLVKDDWRTWIPPPQEEWSDWHEEASYIVDITCRLLEGQEQAMILTKSQLFDGLPASVEQLVGAVELPNQDTQVQRAIMLAQQWTATHEKLPKRIDVERIGYKYRAEYGIPSAKSREVLMDQLLQLGQRLACEYPSLVFDRRMMQRVKLSTFYTFKGDKFINIQGNLDWVISSNQPLPPFLDEEAIDASVNHTLPNIWPIAPTVDLRYRNNYTVESCTGFRQDYTHSHPHIIVLKGLDRWDVTQRNAIALLYTFGCAVAQARSRFGDDVTILPEPISLQCMIFSETCINIICFQLNTMDYSTENGIKNFVWFDANKLFNKLLPQPWRGEEFRMNRYDCYNKDVFKKFLAVYLNGVDLSDGERVKAVSSS